MAADLLDRPYRGGFVDLTNGDREHRFALSVYFEDTDAFGIVYYANYLKYMERARSDMLRAVGIDQAAELGASGSAYAVVEVAIRYRKPARLGDDLLVVSTVDQVLASSVHIHQRVMRGAELLTDARVTAAFLDRDGRPRRQPKDWVERFKQIIAQGQ
jgi:acyl-CoA thioester hydrolase